MAGVGEDKQAAKESVVAIFEALPKTKQMNFIGEYNEVLMYLQFSTPGKAS
jgi:hypothetical protein